MLSLKRWIGKRADQFQKKMLSFFLLTFKLNLPPPLSGLYGIRSSMKIPLTISFININYLHWSPGLLKCVSSCKERKERNPELSKLGCSSYPTIAPWCHPGNDNEAIVFLNRYWAKLLKLKQ